MNAQTLASPVLEDAALLLIQGKLEDELTWLTSAYGRAQRMVRKDGNDRDIYFPGIYAESATGEEYISMLPDATLGNYSYFDLRDEQSIGNYATKSPSKNIYKFGAGLVVFFNFKTVFPSPADWKTQSVANVVQEVSDVLQSAQMAGVSVEITDWFYSPENIYRGYDHREVNRQFAMRPYGVFRIDLDITYRKQC